MEVGDEHHYLFDCLHFVPVRAQFYELFSDASGSMQAPMWHKDQKAVSRCLLAFIVDIPNSGQDDTPS